MNSYLVVEVRVWLVLVLVVLVLGLAVTAFLLLRRWMRQRDARLAAEHVQHTEREGLMRRNRMLIRLDHELKNPLTALRTSAATVREMLRDEAPNRDEISPVVRQIDISSRRVARLLADLRKLADVESRTIDFTRVDMDALIQQAVEDARTAPGAEDRMIVATVARAPWRLPDVAGEEDLLLSAILNLLGNAIKYSADTDVVELRANEQIIRNHRWVVVEVADTGSGIPADEQDSVWDELSRGKRVRSVAGSGMGLSLVRSIIARHGGSVELFSQEGVGTSVRLVLPVLGDAQAPMAPQGWDSQRAVAGSRPVQPFHEQARGTGRHDFRPPRQPSQQEIEDGRIMGSPRRTSKRRLQKVNGGLLDSATGETFGEQHPAHPGPAQSGPVQSGPIQSGPAHPGPVQSGPAQSGPVQPGPAQSGPVPSGPVPSGPVHSGQLLPNQPQRTNQPHSGQYGSGPAPYGVPAGTPVSGPHGSAPQGYGSGPAQGYGSVPPQGYGSGPQQYGSAPGHYGAGPQPQGTAPQNGSAPQAYGSAPQGHRAHPGPAPNGSGPAPYGVGPGPYGAAPSQPVQPQTQQRSAHQASAPQPADAPEPPVNAPERTGEQ